MKGTTEGLQFQFSGGITQYGISWNTNPVQSTPTISDLVADTYVVEVTDSNNCIKRDSVLLIKESNPHSFTYTTSGLVASFSIDGIGCNSFVWDFGNGNTSSINPNPTVTYATAGTYGVCLQCNGQPSSCVQCINISVPSTTNGGVGIDETESGIGISVYPNPSNGNVQIQIDNSPIHHVKIYNQIGGLVYQSEKEITELNLTGYPKGIYLIQVQSGDKILNKKLIIH